MNRPTNVENRLTYDILRSIYDKYIRPYLPNKIGVYNGVAVRDRGLFDVTDEQPGYEGPLIAAIENKIQREDTVAVIGGGRGVSTVIAARATGPNGNVTAYEANKDQYRLVEETIRLNQVENRVRTEFAIVGEAISVWGDENNLAPEKITPSQLDSYDILVSDCEGAELTVLQGYRHQPRAIIVETHGELGAAEEEVVEILNSKGYEITNRESEIDSKGIVILTAEKVSS